MRAVAVGLVAFASVSLVATPALAWSDFGHMEVAAVAFARLNPKAKAKVGQLLKLNPHHADWIVGAKRGAEDGKAFLRAATWADALRSDKKYLSDKEEPPTVPQRIGYADLRRHESWHYVDNPFSPDGTSLLPPRAPNAATVIPQLRASLGAKETTDETKSYDLVWLLHLVGDIHQPLHCGTRFDAADPTGDHGGNNVKITGNARPPVCDDPRYCPFGPPDNLHFFWDDLEGLGYATEPAEAAAATLPKPDAKLAAIADEARWIEEGFELDKSVVYVPPIGIGKGPFTITPAYQGAAEKLGKQRIALAGARLANLINDALGK